VHCETGGLWIHRRQSLVSTGDARVIRGWTGTKRQDSGVDRARNSRRVRCCVWEAYERVAPEMVHMANAAPGSRAATISAASSVSPSAKATATALAKTGGPSYVTAVTWTASLVLSGLAALRLVLRKVGSISFHSG
jgi:hypothetical protein